MEYDPISQLTAGVRRELTPAGVLETVRYDYDAGWNRTRKVQNQNVNAFTFTKGNELISEVSRGLTPISGTTDIASRVTVNNQLATEDAFSTSFSVDLDLAEGTHEIEVVALAENSFTMTTQKWEVESVNTAERTLSYDTLGNLVNDGERTYEWDAENRLVAVEIDEVSRSEFAYDGLSRRVGVTEKVWDSNSSSFIIQTSAFYLWDGLQIAEERNASGVVVKRYFGQGEQWPGEIAPADKRYYLRDHLGSVTGIVDASGTMLVEFGYGLWGERTVLSGTGSSDRGFTGHFTHIRSGLVLAPYRAYDPDTARWLSRDPLGEFADGPNLYSYVLNNPVNLWDPLGLETLILIHRNKPGPKQDPRNACGTMSVFHDGEFQFSTPVNRFGYQEGTNGIYPGTYSVRPRTDAVEKSIYPNGTPAVTAPGQSNPGNAGNGFRNVFIHAEADLAGGDSRGCPTVSADAAQRIKDFMDADQKRGHNTTLKIFNYGGAPYATPR